MAVSVCMKKVGWSTVKPGYFEIQMAKEVFFFLIMKKPNNSKFQKNS
jgi:hypothetical protein